MNNTESLGATMVAKLQAVGVSNATVTVMQMTAIRTTPQIPSDGIDAPETPDTSGTSAKTPDCVVGTSNVYQPSGGSGKCFCGSLYDSNSSIMGYCDPAPEAQNMSSAGCVGDSKDSNATVGGQCQYYCMCDEAKKSWGIFGDPSSKITCCKAAVGSMYLQGGVIVSTDTTDAGMVQADSANMYSSVVALTLSLVIA